MLLPVGGGDDAGLPGLVVLVEQDHVAHVGKEIDQDVAKVGNVALCPIREGTRDQVEQTCTKTIEVFIRVVEICAEECHGCGNPG